LASSIFTNLTVATTRPRHALHQVCDTNASHQVGTNVITFHNKLVLSLPRRPDSKHASRSI